MHITTIFNQTDHSETGSFTYYDSVNFNEYLSDSNSYSNNESDCRSNYYNNYESNYKSDNKETPYALISIIETPLVQLSNIEQNANMLYFLKQEEFNNNNFSFRDLLNAI
jgi:hypothetical protein